jgi:hypothetical protein
MRICKLPKRSTPSSIGLPSFRAVSRVAVWLVYLMPISFAETAFSQMISVAETAGLRRFGYPGYGHFSDQQRVAAFGFSDFSSLDDPQFSFVATGIFDFLRSAVS